MGDYRVAVREWGAGEEEGGGGQSHTLGAPRMCAFSRPIRSHALAI